jgi:hypothetical protein
MKKEVGLWIDHRRAVVVTLNDGNESVEHVEADFEKRGRFSTDMQPDSTGAQHIDMAEDKHQRHTLEMVNHYYESVATQVKDATELLIMGPGQAKVEFQKFLDSHKFNGTVIGVEAVDNLSDAQIAAKVRTAFLAYDNVH